MLNQETINSIQEMYKNGLSKSSIAKQLNISNTTVSKYTKSLKIISDHMIGQKFGSLTVLKRLEKDPKLASRCIRYLCKCDCGREIEVNGNSLRTGHTTSCGCSRKGTKIKDLTGMISGEITFLYPTEERQDRHVIWQCQCSCGAYIKLTSHEFGHTKSCGCIKESLGEKRIKDILMAHNVDFQTQYRFQDCVHIKTLPFDFAVFKNNQLHCLIEYNGQQHYEATSGWNSTEHLLRLQAHDFIKQEYCKKYNLKLIIISYLDYENITWDYLERKINYGLPSDS